MVIAVNARFLQNDRLEGIGYFTKEILRLIIKKNPEHQFHFLLDRPYVFFHEHFPGMVSHIVPPAARHPFLWKIWFDIQIPRKLKEIKADVFLSPDGFCSLTAKVPQCLVVHDLAFLHYPEGIKKSHLIFYKIFTPRFLKKAKSIATVSQFSKKDIIEKYNIPQEKITVTYNASKEVFKPLNYEDQSQVKDAYTDGKEFFIYVGSIHPRKNLLNLLKAFSIFKKRLQSSMKLVLAGRLAWKNDEFLQLLKTYKHKDDVILTGYIEEEKLVSLLASSYAMVYPSLFEGFGVPVLEAMNCDIPVITSKDSSMHEIAEDAALVIDPKDVNDIADKLMLIYKDEELRKQLIQKGKKVREKYSLERTADLLWESVLKATKDGAS